MAQVGFTEVVSREKYGDRLEVVQFSFSANARAIYDVQTDGMIKLKLVRRLFAGVSVVGRSMGELTAFWSFVISQRIKLSKVSSVVAPKTKMSEVSTLSIGDYFSKRLFVNIWIKGVSDLCSKV